MVNEKQKQARDELYAKARNHIDRCVSEYIRKCADALKEKHPDRRTVHWMDIRDTAEAMVTDKTLWGIAGDALHDAGIETTHELYEVLQERLHDELESETCWGSVISEDIIETYDVEMRPEGHPTLKRAMQERGVTAEQIMRHCDTDRLPTIYDRINHGWGTFSPTEMSGIWEWHFSDMDPLVLFDLNQQDLWNLRCDYLSQSKACERMLGMKE